MAPLYPALETAYPPLYPPPPQATIGEMPPYPYPPPLVETVYPAPPTLLPQDTPIASSPTASQRNFVYTCDLPDPHAAVSTYQILQRYPHDPSAYTQGLIFRDGFLYESTGLHGGSSLRKVELQTGAVVEQVEIAEGFFAEGLVELDGKLYQLTWQEGAGFIYNIETFEKQGEFEYTTEGWGLTAYGGDRLLMSDGTDRIFTLDADDLTVTDEIQVADGGGPVTRINELELITGELSTLPDGEVWGNIYQTACIVRFDPQSGAVIGWLDLTGLYEELGFSGAGTFRPEVPNGIAYDAENGRLFVTGKFWPTLFEIQLQPAPESS